MFLFVSAVLASGPLAGGWGQFAQVGEHSLTTMNVSTTGFRVRSPSGVAFRFGNGNNSQITNELPGRTRYWSAVVTKPAEGSPTTVVFETSTLGFSAKFEGRLVLRAEGVGAPFISWDEGSVGPGVPSPPAKWLLLSWPTRQPPILIALPGQGVSLTSRETENGFVVESDASLKGWVRFRSPFGFEEVRTENAADLGRLVQRLKPHLDSLLMEAPRVIDCSASEDKNGITARWQFDRPGAVVPQPVSQLMSSGWLIVHSRLRKAGASSGGYLLECEERELVVRFPCRKLRPGQAVVNGSVQTNIEMNLDDAPSIVDACLAYLMGNGGSHLGFIINRAADAVSNRSSNDLAVRASWALLASVTKTENSLSNELAGIDWISWLPSGETHDKQLEAAAILSFAAALSPSVELRTLGAMAEAGLRAKTGDRRMPLDSVRRAIYATANTPVPDWFRAMTSPVRLLSFDLEGSGDGADVVIHGPTTSESSVALLSQDRMRVAAAVGTERVSLLHEGDRWTLHVVPSHQTTQWRVRLSRGRQVLPNAAPSPRYNEGRR